AGGRGAVERRSAGAVQPAAGDVDRRPAGAAHQPPVRAAGEVPCTTVVGIPSSRAAACRCVFRAAKAMKKNPIRDFSDDEIKVYLSRARTAHEFARNTGEQHRLAHWVMVLQLEQARWLRPEGFDRQQLAELVLELGKCLAGG